MCFCVFSDKLVKTDFVGKKYKIGDRNRFKHWNRGVSGIYNQAGRVCFEVLLKLRGPRIRWDYPPNLVQIVSIVEEDEWSDGSMEKVGRDASFI